MKTIAVIGAGNGSQVLAADCKLAGATVRMFEYEQFNQKVLAIKDTGKIEIYGHQMNLNGVKREGVAELDLVTYDMAEAVKGADHILLAIQARGFEMTFKQLIPLLEDGQIISIFPDNYGSLILRKMMRDMGCTKKVIVAAFDTLPYGTRLTVVDDFETHTNRAFVLYRDNSLRFDTVPSSDAEEYLKRIKEIPALDGATIIHGDTALDIGLANVNPVLHIPSTILNTGAIENWGIIPPVGDKDVYFDIYAHGFSAGIGKVQWRFYQEECEIAKAYGVTLPQHEQWRFNTRSSILTPLFKEPDYVVEFHEQHNMDEWVVYLPGERFDMNTRYLTEDVPAGCNTYYQFAQKAGIHVPVIESMITLASTINGKDYFKEGFQLSDFGMEDMSIEEMVRYMRTGELPK